MKKRKKGIAMSKGRGIRQREYIMSIQIRDSRVTCCMVVVILFHVVIHFVQNL